MVLVQVQVLVRVLSTGREERRGGEGGGVKRGPLDHLAQRRPDRRGDSLLASGSYPASVLQSDAGAEDSGRDPWMVSKQLNNQGKGQDQGQDARFSS